MSAALFRSASLTGSKASGCVLIMFATIELLNLRATPAGTFVPSMLIALLVLTSVVPDSFGVPE